jgi:hypothetical protein
MRQLIAVVSVACCVACSADYPASPTPAPALAGVQIHYTGWHSWVNPGNSVLLRLYAINTEGVYTVPSGVSWFSSNTAVASVTNGTVRGVANGSVEITASYQGHTSRAQVVVLNPNVRFPWLDVRSLSTLETGRTARAQALFYQTASSAPRDVSADAIWSATDPRVFTVEGGLLTGTGPGTGSVTATFNGLTASAHGSVPPLTRLP